MFASVLGFLAWPASSVGYTCILWTLGILPCSANHATRSFRQKGGAFLILVTDKQYTVCLVRFAFCMLCPPFISLEL